MDQLRLLHRYMEQVVGVVGLEETEVEGAVTVTATTAVVAAVTGVYARPLEAVVAEEEVSCNEMGVEQGQQ